MNFLKKGEDSLLDSLRERLDRSEYPIPKEEPQPVGTFREGYINGLKGFMTKNNITGTLMTKANSLESIIFGCLVLW